MFSTRIASIAVTTVAAAGLGLAAVAGAGAASASDEHGYFVALTDYGYGDTSQDAALNLGYAVCDDINHGVPKSVTLRAIYDNTNENVNSADADFLYKAALVHLC
jgi:hypothetical protein